MRGGRWDALALDALGGGGGLSEPVVKRPSRRESIATQIELAAFEGSSGLAPVLNEKTTESRLASFRSSFCYLAT